MSVFASMDDEELCHDSATRAQLQSRLRHDRELQQEYNSPIRNVFDRTSALITAIRRVGCTSEAVPALGVNAIQAEDDEQIALRRGYPDVPLRCTGRVIFGFTVDGIPFIQYVFPDF